MIFRYRRSKRSTYVNGTRKMIVSGGEIEREE